MDALTTHLEAQLAFDASAQRLRLARAALHDFLAEYGDADPMLISLQVEADEAERFYKKSLADLEGLEGVPCP